MTAKQYLAARIPEANVSRLDRLADTIAEKTGMNISRSEVLRAVVERGLAELEREIRDTPKSGRQLHRDGHLDRAGPTAIDGTRARRRVLRCER